MKWSLETVCSLESHCVVDGRTSIGAETHVFPFVSIGLASQDLKYQGEPSETQIGKRNNIREFVTIHRGTAGGGMLTKTGDDCLIMAQAHIAHDCLDWRRSNHGERCNTRRTCRD